MQATKNSGALNKFKQQYLFFAGKIFPKIDLSRLDKHQSLTFVKKTFDKNPSDIAQNILFLIICFVSAVEGMKIFTILMCYLLPIGIMILKICSTVKNEKQEKKQQRIKDKNDKQSSHLSEQKNDSTLSIESKNQAQKDQQKEPLISSNNQKPNTIQQKPTLTELNKHFITYFIVNLALELLQPFLLLLIQNIFNIFLIVSKYIQTVIQEGNFFILGLIPFQFLGHFIKSLFIFWKPTQYSLVALVLFRVLFSAYFLNMNKQKRYYCQKFLFESNCLPLLFKKVQQSSKQKTQ